MAVDSKARIREFIDTVLNAGDIDATADYFREGVVAEVPFPGQGPGIEGLKSVLRQFRMAFPDSYWKVEEQIADGEKVLTRFTWTGTHKAEFLGIPATGRVVSVWGMVLDRLQGSKVKSTRILMDTLGMMQQLGVVPAGPGSHTEAARFAYLGPVIGGKERQSMAARIQYSDEPLGDLKVIPDFLPSPDELAFREEGVKVTIALSKKSVEFFKAEAAKHHTQYQHMIRRLLDAYRDAHSRPQAGRSTRTARKRAVRQLGR